MRYQPTPLGVPQHFADDTGFILWEDFTTHCSPYHVRSAHFYPSLQLWGTSNQSDCSLNVTPLVQLTILLITYVTSYIRSFIWLYTHRISWQFMISVHSTILPLPSGWATEICVQYSTAVAYTIHTNSTSILHQSASNSLKNLNGGRSLNIESFFNSHKVCLTN